MTRPAYGIKRCVLLFGDVEAGHPKIHGFHATEIDIGQPDPGWLGGDLGLRKLAELEEWIKVQHNQADKY